MTNKIMLILVVLSVVGCSCQPRFQQTATPTIMFDNKTAQYCDPFPRAANEPRGMVTGAGLHFCQDLK